MRFFTILDLYVWLFKIVKSLSPDFFLVKSPLWFFSGENYWIFYYILDGTGGKLDYYASLYFKKDLWERRLINVGRCFS